MKLKFIRGGYVPVVPVGILLSCLVGNKVIAQADTGAGKRADSSVVRNVDSSIVRRADSIRRGEDTGGLTKPVQLREAVVTGRLPLVQRTLDKTIINVEASITAAGSSVWELMRKLPGVQVDPDGEISLNGKGGVTIYIDGRVSYLSGDDLAAFLKGMNADDIKKIELIPNPSARYAAAGSGGVINIVRKKNRRPGWNGNLRANWTQTQYGSWGMGGNINYHKDVLNLNLQTNYQRSTYQSGSDLTNRFYSSDMLTGYQQTHASDENETHSGSVVFMGDLDLSKRTSLSMTVTGSKQGHVDNVYAGQRQFGANGVATGVVNFFDRNKGSSPPLDAVLRMVHKIDTAGQELSTEISYGRYTRHSLQTISNQYFDAGGVKTNDSLQFMDRAGNLNVYTARLDYTLPVSRKGRIETGLESSYTRNRVRQQYRGSPPEYEITKENINSVYLMMNKEWQQWVIQAGLRGEESWIQGTSVDTLGERSGLDRGYWLLFPSISAEYRIDSFHRINLQVARRVLRPGYNLLNPLHDPMSASSWYQGNPGLQPQLNNNVELSWSWRDRLTLSFGTLIYQHFYRRFTFSDSAHLSTYIMPEAIPHAWGLYGQIIWNARPASWWQIDFNAFMYQRWFGGELNGVRPDVIPVFTFNCTVENEFTLGKGWTAECTNIYGSPRQVISTRLGYTNNLSVGLRKQLWDGRATCNVNVNNIFQTEGYGYLERTDQLEVEGRQYSFSRSVGMSLSYRLGKKSVYTRHEGPRGIEGSRRE